jgi:hypothetical protein
MITVIDDFMPKEYFKQLQDFLLNSNFPWYFTPRASKYDPGPSLEHAVESPAFTHRVYCKYENSKSGAFQAFIPLIDKIDELLEHKQELIRLRVALKTYQHGFTKDNYNLPHVDFPCPHTSAVYYLNDSDGDTHFFDQYYQGKNEPTNYTITQRVSPKSNRILIFDGLQYHTASNPINSDRRLIANINFIQKGTDLEQERVKYLNTL